jgi:serine/threonine protein kinase
LDLKSIDEDIFSLTRTSLENEVAAQTERKRKDMVTGPHLVFQPTPFVLQRFISRKKKRDGDSDDHSISPAIFAAWFHDLLSALLHCHANDIVLRTFQTDQIVIDHSGVAKIGGLYRATVLSQEDKTVDIVELARSRKNKPSKPDDDEILSNPYASPEMLLGSPKFTKETDIWTMGCLFAHLLLNKPIYSGKDRQSILSAMYKMIGTPAAENYPQAAKFPRYKKPTKKYKPGVAKALQFMMKEEEGKEHAGAIDLISQMLHLDPKKRISAVGALQHEYMLNYVENCSSESVRQQFVCDWMSLKKKLMRSSKTEEDEIKERARGIKRKAMLMAASKSMDNEEDDLYDMDDILGGGGSSKMPKI